jgi:hypothetical protein
MVDTRFLPEGTSAVEGMALDTAGNRGASSSTTVHIDNTAPVAPTISGEGAWSSSPDGTWSWSVPAESDRAPIVAVQVERCLGGECAIEDLGAKDFGAPVSYSRHLPEGVSTLRARHRDAAGNFGEWSDAAALRSDRTAPSLELSVGSQTAVEGVRIEPGVSASDALSGVAQVRLESRVDGGTWQPAWGGASGRRGERLQFRASATDRAGNATAWRVSPEIQIVEPPFATPALGPAAKDRARVAFTSVRLTWSRGRLVIRGRLSPNAITGTIRVTTGRRTARARIRNGRFTVRIKAIGKRVRLAYPGDAAHLPTARNLRIPRRARAAARPSGTSTPPTSA